MTRIETRDANGNVNGWLAPLWHADQGPKIEQVYITAVAPGCMKGPHLHMKRRGLFYLISGTGALVLKTNDYALAESMVTDPKGWPAYRFFDLNNGYAVFYHANGIQVPAGIACALYNTGNIDAVFLNMPSPPWRADEPDEHPVEDWGFKL